MAPRQTGAPRVEFEQTLQSPSKITTINLRQCGLQFNIAILCAGWVFRIGQTGTKADGSFEVGEEPGACPRDAVLRTTNLNAERRSSNFPRTRRAPLLLCGGLLRLANAGSQNEQSL